MSAIADATPIRYIPHDGRVETDPPRAHEASARYGVPLPNLRHLDRSIAAGPDVLASLPSRSASDAPTRREAALRGPLIFRRAWSRRGVPTHPTEHVSANMGFKYGQSN